MKKLIIITSLVVIAIIAVIVLQNTPQLSGLLWDLSRGGTWLLPMVLVAALLDSVHPCSFSILLVTIAFLFGIQMSRKKILEIGATYIAGIFTAYLLIGVGILKVLHLFNTPHFMGKLGAAILITFGIINLLNRFFPNFPIKMKIPSFVHGPISRLIEKTGFLAAFGLGFLVGICQFPCMGGPYLMVIGLLRDKVTYLSGFGYLVLYNLILIVPLVAVLYIASQKVLLDKVQIWKNTNIKSVHLWAGIGMIIIGLLVLTL